MSKEVNKEESIRKEESKEGREEGS